MSNTNDVLVDSAASSESTAKKTLAATVRHRMQGMGRVS
jgi:hypothetical protein